MHFIYLVHGDFIMGGLNEATCPPLSSKASGSHSVRFHEVSSRGEVDFHNDTGGLKCSVDTAIFFDVYNKWRIHMSNELVLNGHDGCGGHSSVSFIPYLDAGKMQISMAVKKAQVGQTLLDLDKLAGFEA